MTTARPREPLPRFIELMLVGTGRRAPVGEDWAAEVKWDGMRAQVRFDRGNVTVRSRRGRDWSGCFRELGELARAAPRPAILDGELVCFDEEGHPDFARLRARLAGARELGPGTLVIFDGLSRDLRVR